MPKNIKEAVKLVLEQLTIFKNEAQSGITKIQIEMVRQKLLALIATFEKVSETEIRTNFIEIMRKFLYWLDTGKENEKDEESRAGCTGEELAEIAKIKAELAEFFIELAQGSGIKDPWVALKIFMRQLEPNILLKMSTTKLRDGLLKALVGYKLQLDDKTLQGIINQSQVFYIAENTKKFNENLSDLRECIYRFCDISGKDAEALIKLIGAELKKFGNPRDIGDIISKNFDGEARDEIAKIVLRLMSISQDIGKAISGLKLPEANFQATICKAAGAGLKSLVKYYFSARPNVSLGSSSSSLFFSPPTSCDEEKIAPELFSPSLEPFPNSFAGLI